LRVVLIFWLPVLAGMSLVHHEGGLQKYISSHRGWLCPFLTLFPSTKHGCPPVKDVQLEPIGRLYVEGVGVVFLCIIPI